MCLHLSNRKSKHRLQLSKLQENIGLSYPLFDYPERFPPKTNTVPSEIHFCSSFYYFLTSPPLFFILWRRLPIWHGEGNEGCFVYKSSSFFLCKRGSSLEGYIIRGKPLSSHKLHPSS